MPTLEPFRMAIWTRRVFVVAFVAWMTIAACGPTAAQELIPGNESLVRLEVGKGALVRLSRPASTVFVADPDICDIQVKSPRLVYLLGRAPGETTLYAVDAGERVLANTQVIVSHNLSSLTNALRSLYPNENITVSTFADSIVLDGIVSSAEVAERARQLADRLAGKDGEVINRLSVQGPNQVNLRVRVAEMGRDLEKQLGFNWTYIGEIFDLDVAIATFNPFSATGVITDTASITSRNGARGDVNALIDLLDEEGLISILAEPNLTAMSGETASFLAGGEFPILVPQDDSITVEFKKFGVSLAFTPTVLASSRINMHVRPEVSQLSNDGAISLPISDTTAITVPALTTRRAETTVELASGQSFAIAGLLSNDSVHDARKIPGLGDVPILGRLFRSDRFVRDESELVIMVTPYLVRPTVAHLAAPTDGFRPPNDLERIFPGGTWSRDRQPGPPSTVGPDGSRTFGSVGFVLD